MAEHEAAPTGVRQETSGWQPRQHVWEIFAAFAKLGSTSFGGPIAHLVYFRRELVERRGWLAEGEYAQLIGLCQFLPGPASSQLGFSLGLLRGGWPGAIAAFVAFTLPSALLLFAFAVGLAQLSGRAGAAAFHGLELVALAVVAHGVQGMARRLCPDGPRATIATLAAVAVLLVGQVWIQLVVVVLGGLTGLAVCRRVPGLVCSDLRLRYGPRLGGILLVVFVLLLVGLPLVASTRDGLVAVAAGFYRAGALVFGGGHVVLPLLEEAVVGPGWIPADEFLAGYGAAQAVPGPMFTLAAFLGARLPADHGGLLGATVALGAIFLPGFLLVAGFLPFWRAMADRPRAARVVAGVNAAVVGLLGAALYDPVWTRAVGDAVDVAIALAAFALLAVWRAPAILVVVFSVAASIGAAFLLI